MRHALVRSNLKSLWVVFNGDRDDQLPKQLEKLDTLGGRIVKLERELKSKPTTEAINEIKSLQRQVDKLKDEAQDNAVVCKLSYPRSGSSSVESIKRVRLPNGKVNGKPPINNASTVFLEHGLFKEEIQGEALLQVAITDADPRNAFLSFFRRVLSTAFAAATKGLISDISGVVTNSTATVLSKDIAESLAGGKKKQVQLIASSDKVRIGIDENGGLTVENTGPGISYSKGVLKLALKAPQYLQVASNKYLPRGGGNGEIEISLESEKA